MVDTLLSILRAVWGFVRHGRNGREHREDFRVTVKGLRLLIEELRQQLDLTMARVHAGELHTAECQEQHEECQERVANLRREIGDLVDRNRRLEMRVRTLENGSGFAGGS